MRRLTYLLMLLVLTCATSCIEEYNELPDGASDRVIVIEGQIVSQSECTFSIRYSAMLGTSAILSRQPVSRAMVSVVGSKGEVFVGYENFDSPGYYQVKVGKLDPDVAYSLRVDTEDGVYTSRPMLPLDAPEITELCFEQPREDRLVDFYVSTADPQQTAYYRWDFRETWEIYTPYTSRWEYEFDDPDEFEAWDPTIRWLPVPKGDFRMLDHSELKNHGWRTRNSRELYFASNIDYGQGAIQRLCLYQLDADDICFQTRYLTQVRQMAISAEEYEYLHLLATQSTEMGGLFTPMPSELPGNITRQDGVRAIGYVGVRGHVSERQVYVNRRDVGHKDLYVVRTVADTLVKDPPYMIKAGYKIADYNPYMGSIVWTDRWAVDCTDYFWHASLKRPEYWEDLN